LVVNRYEWDLACKHARFPGIGQPVIEVRNRRCRLSNEQIQSFLEVLTDDTNFQRTSFGTKILKLQDDLNYERIERVYTTKKFVRIFQDYVNTVLLPKIENVVDWSEIATTNQLYEAHDHVIESSDSCEDVSDDDDNEDHSDTDDLILTNTMVRCPKQSRTGGLSCTKHVDHTGRCKFTPKTMICQKTCIRILKTLTAGNITSLFGLDGVDVEKGRNNWRQLKSIVSRVLVSKRRSVK